VEQPNPYTPPQSDSAFGSGPGNEHSNRVLAVISGPFRWLFAPERRPVPWRVIVWWELRRIPVNLLIGVYGILCLVVLLWAITSSHVLEPGEDAFEPLAIMITPVLFNIGYTLGWLVEVPARLANPRLSPRFGPLLMKLGLGFSICVIGCPAAMWVGYRCLQLVRVIHSE
jgi:hypothetical protein